MEKIKKVKEWELPDMILTTATEYSRKYDCSITQVHRLVRAGVLDAIDIGKLRIIILPKK